jgi:hypothetical protein
MSEDDGVGQKSKRNGTTWKPGQCGNPRRVRPRPNKTLKQIVDACFAEEVRTRIEGKVRRMTTYEAIVSVLQLKAPADRRARRVLRQYKKQAVEANGGRTIELHLKPEDEQRLRQEGKL